MSSTIRKVFEGGFSVSAGQAVDMFFGLIVTLLLVRLLNVTEYGTYILVISVLTFAGGFADLGISGLVSSRVAGYAGAGKAGKVKGFLSGYAKFAFGASLAIMAVVFVAADWIAAALAADIASLLRLAVGLVMLQAAHTFFTYALFAYTEFMGTLKMTIALEASRLAFVVAFVWGLGLGLQGAVVAYVLSFAVSLSVGALLFLKKVYGNIKGVEPEKAFGKVMRKEGGFVAASSITKLVRANAIVWIIAALAGTAYVAYYSVAITVLGAFLIPLTAFESTLYPLIARSMSQGIGGARIIYNKAIKYGFLMSLVLAAIMLAFIGDIVKLVFTPDYAFSLFFYRVLAVSVIVSGLWVSIRPLLYAKGKQKEVFVSNIIIVGVLLLLSFALLPIEPKLATTAYVASSVVGFLYYMHVLRKMGFSISLKHILETDKYDRLVLAKIRSALHL